MVDRKNARVWTADKELGVTMPVFKMVMKNGAHVFKVHEKAELPGVPQEEFKRLVARATEQSRCNNDRPVVV